MFILARTTVLLALLVLLTETACAPRTAAPSAPADGSSSRVLWLISHGWHVGLAVARADVPSAVWPERDDLGPFRFLEVGWGDAAFYPAAEGTIGLALRAAFRSTASVLHVAAFDAPPTRYFAASDIIELPVSHQGFDDLCRFIAGYYAKADGRAVALGAGLYGPSRFYRAHGHYRLSENSNHWTARALQSAGLSVDPEDALTAGQVLAQARRLRGF